MEGGRNARRIKQIRLMPRDYSDVSKTKMKSLLWIRGHTENLEKMTKQQLCEQLAKDDKERMESYKMNETMHDLTNMIYNVCEIDEISMANSICKYAMRFEGSIPVFKDDYITNEIKHNSQKCNIFTSDNYIGCIKSDIYIFIYDAYNADHLWTYMSDSKILNAAFHPNETSIALLKSTCVNIIDIKSGDIKKRFICPIPFTHMLSVSYSSSGAFLAIGTTWGIMRYNFEKHSHITIKYFDENRFEEFNTWYKNVWEQPWSNKVIFSPDEKYMMTGHGTKGGFVIVWSVEDGEVAFVLNVFKLTAVFDGLIFSQDSKKVIINTKGIVGNYRVWGIFELEKQLAPIQPEIIDCPCVYSTHANTQYEPKKIALNKNGTIAASVSQEYFNHSTGGRGDITIIKIRIYTYPDFKHIKEINTQSNAVPLDIKFTSSSSHIILLTSDNIIHIINLT